MPAVLANNTPTESVLPAADEDQRQVSNNSNLTDTPDQTSSQGKISHGSLFDPSEASNPHTKKDLAMSDTAPSDAQSSYMSGQKQNELPPEIKIRFSLLTRLNAESLLAPGVLSMMIDALTSKQDDVSQAPDETSQMGEKVEDVGHLEGDADENVPLDQGGHDQWKPTGFRRPKRGPRIAIPVH